MDVVFGFNLLFGILPYILECTICMVCKKTQTLDNTSPWLEGNQCVNGITYTITYTIDFSFVFYQEGGSLD